MVYALTSKMTQATYESFFNIVLRVLPLNYAQLTIVTDYERGLMNAVRNIFIESNLQGCWFHYFLNGFLIGDIDSLDLQKKLATSEQIFLVFNLLTAHDDK